MKTIISSIALVALFLVATAFSSTRESNYKGRTELDQLYAKAKSDHKELAQFEDEFQELQAKINSERITFRQKIQARERLHQQAKALMNSIRNETIKKHVVTIQNSYFAQFNRLKNKQAGKVKPIDDELSISRDWLNAMKIAYSLDQNRILEKEIERELDASSVTVDEIKELNSTGKRLVTKMLTPAD